MAEPFPHFSNAKANKLLHLNAPQFQQARFLDIHLPGDFIFPADAGLGFPRIIDMTTLDAKVFSTQPGSLTVINASTREQIGINALDAVTTLVHTINPGALRDLFNPDTTFNLTHCSTHLNLQIVKEAKTEHLPHQVLDISSDNGMKAKIRYERAMEGSWHLTISKVEPATDWYNEGVDPCDDPEALNVDFLVAKELLTNKDLLQPGHNNGGHDVGLWCYALIRSNQTPTKAQPLHAYKPQTGMNNTTDAQQLKRSVLYLIDEYAERVDTFTEAQRRLIEAAKTLIRASDPEVPPSDLHQEINKTRALLDESVATPSKKSTEVPKSHFLVLN